jgi:hypothetical protein
LQILEDKQVDVLLQKQKTKKKKKKERKKLICRCSIESLSFLH